MSIKQNVKDLQITLQILTYQSQRSAFAYYLKGEPEPEKNSTTAALPDDADVFFSSLMQTFNSNEPLTMVFRGVYNTMII